jgi:hypothetical protein
MRGRVFFVHKWGIKIGEIEVGFAVSSPPVNNAEKNHAIQVREVIAEQDIAVNKAYQALKQWVLWERDQVKKEGRYVGEAINKLIKSGEEALAEFEKSYF